MSRDWRGCVKAKKGYLYLRVKDSIGTWVDRAPYPDRPLPDTPANRRTAEHLLDEVSEKLHARERVGGGPGPTTVRAWSRRWLEDRRRQGIADAVNDESRLEHHVLPLVGAMTLDDVRPRHMVDIVNQLRERGRAPRTIRNVYSVVQAMFRDAEIEGLTENRPCILTARQLGKVRDKRPGWRESAIYTRAELADLVFGDRIPLARRVIYALLGVGMMRDGEVAGLRWRRLALDAEPLGRISIITSYDDGTTKTEVERPMPIHPALGSLLAEWKLSGWAQAFGRAPEPEDLVCPVPPEPPRKGRKKPPGSMLDRHWIWKRLQRDLTQTLQVRGRRAHDLRRTGISLARQDGADKYVLKRGTHAPPKEMIELYTHVDWEQLCHEVAKLRLERKRGAEVVVISKEQGTRATRKVETAPGTRP